MNIRSIQNRNLFNLVIYVVFFGVLAIKTLTLNSQQLGKTILKESGTIVDYMTFLDPPSTLPYNLKKFKKKKVIPSNKVNTVQALNLTELFFPYKVIQRLYPPDKGLKNGFFVEAGALDGELLSNTLYLELELGWSGLLVEPFLESYRKLRKKHRKVWTCHCCLGIEQSPYKTHLANHISRRNNRYIDATPEELKHGSNFIVGSKHADEVDASLVGMEYEAIQCLPIKSLLKELKVERIDLFSLDVEGSELGVLETFPWDDVKVEVWVVEHFNLDADRSLRRKLDLNFISWFSEKGYDLYDSNAHSGDYIFILKNSSMANGIS